MQYYLIYERKNRKQHIFELWMNIVTVHNIYADKKIPDLREIHHIKVEQVCTSSNEEINNMLLPFRQILSKLVELKEGIKTLSNEEFTQNWQELNTQLVTAMERV